MFVVALIQNISLVVFIAVFHHYAERSLSTRQWPYRITNGLLFGLTAILAMLSPLRFSEGIIYDARSIILGIAGNFGGPWVASIAAGVSLLFRIIILGGEGKYAGALTIFLASSIGVGAYYYRRQRPNAKCKLRCFWLIGIIIHVATILSQLLLPGKRWAATLPVIAPTFLIVFPLGYTLIAALFLENEERSENQRRLKASEERYRSLFNNRHTVMLLLDFQTGKIIDANPAAEAFYGWPRQTLLSMSAKDLNTLSPEEITKEMEITEGKNSNIYHFEHRTASGDVRNVEVFTGPVEFLGKKALFSIVHDETARVKAEQEVLALNQSLEQRVAQRTADLAEANKELEAFSYSVSHDLRAPLRAIEGFSAVLAEETGNLLPTASRHYLERISSNATKMNTLIDDMLRLSKIGRQQLQKSHFDLAQLAEAIALEMADLYPDKKMETEFQSPLQAYGDKPLVDILLRNLLANSWKYSIEKEKPWVKLYAIDRNGEPTYCVEDNGVGFDMANAERLFAPFQRLHSEKAYSGTGIGLSIVRRIAARHGGRVWAEAEPGKGARFYFSLGGLT
ncbi:MAG: LytS/YhcK type 5TM receptor domain-containing protein [Spirochaetia bacterium]|jgi:PAS domain S-box-containing protein|nr:LytS/YhcK type 5TM receptor domain-containing protein [Spirochaetia bacterium]